MEKVRTVNIMLEMDERKLLDHTIELLDTLTRACRDEPDLADLKAVAEKAWLALDFILEETDI